MVKIAGGVCWCLRLRGQPGGDAVTRGRQPEVPVEKQMLPDRHDSSVPAQFSSKDFIE